MCLCTLLALPLVLLIVVPAVIIAGASLYTGSQEVGVLSRQSMDDISARVGQAAVLQLEEASVTLLATFPNADDNHDASIELFTDTERLERKLFELTAAARTTAYFHFGRKNGGFVGIDRGRPGPKVRLQFACRKAAVTRVKIVRHECQVTARGCLRPNTEFLMRAMDLGINSQKPRNV